MPRIIPVSFSINEWGNKMVHIAFIVGPTHRNEGLMHIVNKYAVLKAKDFEILLSREDLRRERKIS